MLIQQSRQSRLNIRCERVVSKNDRSFTAQLFQIEATRSVLEERETMDPSFRIRGHELRSEGFSQTRTGLETKGTMTSSSAGVALVGRHLSYAYTRKQHIIAKRSAEAELYAAALGAYEAKGVLSMMCELSFPVNQY